MAPQTPTYDMLLALILSIKDGSVSIAVKMELSVKDGSVTHQCDICKEFTESLYRYSECGKNACVKCAAMIGRFHKTCARRNCVQILDFDAHRTAALPFTYRDTRN